jgi:hypothetical protein
MFRGFEGRSEQARYFNETGSKRKQLDTSAGNSWLATLEDRRAEAEPEVSACISSLRIRADFCKYLQPKNESKNKLIEMRRARQIESTCMEPAAGSSPQHFDKSLNECQQTRYNAPIPKHSSCAQLFSAEPHSRQRPHLVMPGC